MAALLSLGERPRELPRLLSLAGKENLFGEL
jgi:hypothetical protein